MSPAGSPFICTFHTHTPSLNNAPGPLRPPPLENGIGFSSPNYNQTGVSSKTYFPSIWVWRLERPVRLLWGMCIIKQNSVPKWTWCFHVITLPCAMGTGIQPETLPQIVLCLNMLTVSCQASEDLKSWSRLVKSVWTEFPFSSLQVRFLAWTPAGFLSLGILAWLCSDWPCCLPESSVCQPGPTVCSSFH